MLKTTNTINLFSLISINLSIVEIHVKHV